MLRLTSCRLHLAVRFADFRATALQVSGGIRSFQEH